MLQQDFYNAAFYYINRAAEGGVYLELNDFKVIDDEITIDGMSAGEWIYAMCEMN